MVVRTLRSPVRTYARTGRSRGSRTADGKAPQTRSAGHASDWRAGNRRLAGRRDQSGRNADTRPDRDAAIRTAAIYLVLTSAAPRSEEHTSELQSLMRISYPVSCLKTKTHHT